MTSLYFEEAEVGKLRVAGPYLVSRDEIIEFAKKSIRSPSTLMKKLPRAQFLQD